MSIKPKDEQRHVAMGRSAMTFVRAAINGSIALVTLMVAAGFFMAAEWSTDIKSTGPMTDADWLLASVGHFLWAGIAGVVIGGMAFAVQWPLYRYAGFGTVRTPFRWAMVVFFALVIAGLAGAVRLYLERPWV